MASFSINLDYITGRSVAAQVSDRDAAEWPPHPGRVFMALAAACFEMGEAADEVAALEWLESLPPPAIHASGADERSRVAVYVPVNDKVTATKSLLQSTPGLSRSKQERSFPTVIPHHPVVRLVWDCDAVASGHLEALSRVCGAVIRVGHSSSLVRAWISTDPIHPEVLTADVACWRPRNLKSQIRLRVARQGELVRLRVACKADRINRFAELVEQIETTKGKKKNEAKAKFETEFGVSYRNSLRPPETTPPVIGTWQGYSNSDDDGEQEGSVIVEGQHFDSKLLILSKMDGRSLGVEDTLALTSRLRDAAMVHCTIQPPPTWLSGHDRDGSAASEPHVAFLALPYVGGPYADGHLMGLALALPRSVPPEERGQALSQLLVGEDGRPHNIELKLGRLGEWTVRLEERDEPPKSLRNEMWVGSSRSWASVTPVVLDRFPKTSLATDRKGWHDEVTKTVALSCERAGLPQPTEIDIDTTSWHEGSPRAVRKNRTSRSQRDSAGDSSSMNFASGPLGNGFPPCLSRPGKPSRPQVHIRLEFSQSVLGPVILGAGRFLGYGFCKPLKEKRRFS